MLLHIPQVLTPAELDDIRQALQRSEWVDGRSTVGTQGAQVKRNRQLPESSAAARELGQKVLSALARNPLYFAAALPVRTVPPLFNRYEDSEHYGFHIDGAVRALSGSAGWLRTDLSATLFLCEPEDYEGGELVVKDTYGEHEVKLPAGDMILYPSNSLHCVTPVTRGARVCSFFWIQSMIRDDQHRSMLFELDQTIQRLRAEHGETEEVLGLTNHYHNLLREWAEV